MDISMTYENWREAIRQEYTTMVNLSYYLNGAGQTRMKVLEILYLLSEQCQTAEQLIDILEHQDISTEDVNLLNTNTGITWLDALR